MGVLGALGVVAWSIGVPDRGAEIDIAVGAEDGATTTAPTDAGTALPAALEVVVEGRSSQQLIAARRAADADHMPGLAPFTRFDGVGTLDATGVTLHRYTALLTYPGDGLRPVDCVALSNNDAFCGGIHVADAMVTWPTVPAGAAVVTLDVGQDRLWTRPVDRLAAFASRDAVQSAAVTLRAYDADGALLQQATAASDTPGAEVPLTEEWRACMDSAPNAQAVIAAGQADGHLVCWLWESDEGGPQTKGWFHVRIGGHDRASGRVEDSTQLLGFEWGGGSPGSEPQPELHGLLPSGFRAVRVTFSDGTHLDIVPVPGLPRAMTQVFAADVETTPVGAEPLP